MIKLDKTQSPYNDITDINYPNGKAVNTSDGDSYDGTPITAELINDIHGGLESVVKEAFGTIAGVSGVPDNCTRSDFLNAIKKLNQDVANEAATNLELETQQRTTEETGMKNRLEILEGDVSDATAAIQRNTDANSVEFPFGGERFIVFDFSKTNHKTIKIKKGTHIKLDIVGEDSRWLDVLQDESIDLTSGIQAAISASGDSRPNGRDFYLYLVPDGENDVKIVVSANSTFPNDIDINYNANNTRKIGQFHTLCTNAGNYASGLYCKMAVTSGSVVVGASYPVKTYKDDTDGFVTFYSKEVKEATTGSQYGVIKTIHPLEGFLAGEIIPESVWCLSFRPKCNPDGMVYDVDTDMAIDIYLQSGTGKNTVSAYGGTATDTRPQVCHKDDMRQVGKRLLTDVEFTSAAVGSNEKTAVVGSTDKVTTGGWTDTAGRRMISAIGCEDMCGFMWQWLSDVAPLGNSDWRGVDAQNEFGQMYGTVCGLVAGGAWGRAAYCGSRSRTADHAVSHAYDSIGGRGASRLTRGA